MKRILRNLFLLAGVAFISSCNINSSLMLKTPKDYNYDELRDSITVTKYKIAPNDILSFRIFSNDGFKLIDLTSTDRNFVAPGVINGMNYTVEYDGTVKLPILGRIKLSEMTVREAELHLEQLYAEFYVKPFVMLQVSNRRVIVFPGLAGSARVINLQNENTTLIEALALAGGISSNGKAKKIKLIRGEAADPEVFLIDLSTIEGINKGNMILQANDLIYVEPRLNISSELLKEVTPVLSLISSILLAYSLVRNGI